MKKYILSVNPNTKTKEITEKYRQKYEVCKQKGKQIFIVIECENVNAKSYFKLELNRLNMMGVLFLFIPFWRFSS